MPDQDKNIGEGASSTGAFSDVSGVRAEQSGPDTDGLVAGGPDTDGLVVGGLDTDGFVTGGPDTDRPAAGEPAPGGAAHPSGVAAHPSGGGKRDQSFSAKREAMTTAPVEKLVLRMAIPTISTMMITSAYSMTDTYFISTLGTSATAAVGIAFPLMAVIQAFGFFFGQGSGNYISRELGANRMDNAARMATTGFFSSLAAGAVLAVIWLIFLEPLALLLGSTPTILPYAVDYLRFTILGTPFMIGSLVLNNLLRYQGSAFYGMVGMTCGAIMNILLDPLFIFALGMGVSGASLATLFSQMFGCAILLAGSTKKDNIRIRPKLFSPSGKAYYEMLRGGLPSLCRQGISSVAAVVLNQFARGYGDAAIAAISIVQRVTMMSYSALIGFGQGFQPVCGFNFGAGRYDRVKRAFWFCIKVSAVFLVLFGVVLFVFATPIITIFRADDAEVIRIGSLSLKLQAIAYPLFGWVIFNNMMMQTTGKPVHASILSLSRQGLFLLPALFISVPLLGLLGIQISQPIADAGSFILAIPLYNNVRKGFNERKGW